MKSMNPQGGRLIGFAIFCVAACAGAGAVASPAANVAGAVTVTYSQAELAREDGAKQVYRRIEAAAREACGTFDIRELANWQIAQSCYQRAVNDAVLQVNATRLTEIHRTRSQHSSPS
jgi:UrcA family protein